MLKIRSIGGFKAVILIIIFTAHNALANTVIRLERAASGGQATVYNNNSNAFSLPSANMPLMQQVDFSVGNSFFRNPWVIAPASTKARDGLGPLMNTNGCQNCHIKDGRGHAPLGPEDSAVSLLVRLSIPTEEGFKPEPTYGEQLQDFAIPGILPEGKIQITYTEKVILLGGGDSISVREPKLTLKALAYGQMHPQTQFSARIAPPMIGLGLLEAIPEKAILANADPSDADNDGISGKANFVEHIASQTKALGRFGWKAGQPTVRQQNAAAFNGDLGITSHLFPNDHCTTSQERCRRAPSGGSPELSDAILDQVTFYAQNLAVPARRDTQHPQVIWGEQVFQNIGCEGCHVSSWQTGASAEHSWLANQKIYPYTDLLLHDMGEGLADHRPEVLASGREWRTPPLWGIGLSQIVNDQATFLHDGRARTLAEAILWHGGEAKKSQQQFQQLSREDRQALLAFLNSL